jgi:hypothetical protein
MTGTDIASQLTSQLSWNSSSIVSMGLIVLGLLFFGVVIIFIYAYFTKSLWFKEYPLHVLNRKIEGKSVIIDSVDYARVFNTNQGDMLELKNRKRLFKPTSYLNFLKGSWIELLWLSRDEPRPVTLEAYVGKVAVWDEDAKIWIKKTDGVIGLRAVPEEHKLAFTSVWREQWERFTKSNFFEKYYWLIMLVVTAVAILLVTWVVMQFMQPLLNASQSTASSFNNATQSLNAIVQHCVVQNATNGLGVAGAGLTPP